MARLHKLCPWLPSLVTVASPVFQLPKTRNHLHLRPASCRSMNQSLIAQWINRFRSFPASKYLLSSIPIFSTPVLPTIFLIYRLVLPKITIPGPPKQRQTRSHNVHAAPPAAWPRSAVAAAAPPPGRAAAPPAPKSAARAAAVSAPPSGRDVPRPGLLDMAKNGKMEKWKYQWNSWIGKMTDLNFGISSEKSKKT